MAETTRTHFNNMAVISFEKMSASDSCYDRRSALIHCPNRYFNEYAINFAVTLQVNYLNIMFERSCYLYMLGINLCYCLVFFPR